MLSFGGASRSPYEIDNEVAENRCICFERGKLFTAPLLAFTRRRCKRNPNPDLYHDVNYFQTYIRIEYMYLSSPVRRLGIMA